jgi:F0F1-type ATP synthase membrane subunit a
MMHLLLAVEDPLDDVLPHTFFNFLGLHVNNQMIMAGVAAILMLLIFPRLFSKPESSAPTGAKNFFESILEFLRVEVFRPALKEHTDQFLPFLWTLFFFILFCNVLGCIPFASIFELITGGHVTHLGGAATGGISTTAALAIAAFFFIHGQGIDTIARALMNGTYGQHHDHHDEHTADGGHGHEAAVDLEHARGDALPADVPANFKAIGDPTKHYTDDRHLTSHQAIEAAAAHSIDNAVGKMTPLQAIIMAIPYYLWNFAPHPFRPKEGEPKIMWLADIPMFGMLLILELFGALVKPFALCMRLFANMVAGHVLLAVLIGLIIGIPAIAMQLTVGIPVALLDLAIQLLEVFVAFLQAYIFTFLTTLFLASAVAPEH